MEEEVSTGPPAKRAKTMENVKEKVKVKVKRRRANAVEEEG